MEEWEQNQIRTNMTELVNLTDCDSLIAVLREKDLLNESDIKRILVEQNGERKKTEQLYEILLGREHAFDGLMMALKATCQTHPFHILNNSFLANPLKYPVDIAYNKRDLLGTGCLFTKVYKGTFGKRTVAVKKINQDYISPDVVLKEVEFLARCNWHENIIRYYGAQVRGIFIYIALELCDTTLTKWIANAEFLKSPQTEIDTLYQATCGVSHLHSLNIAHRDIKPDNILLIVLANGELRVKISDFGLSRRLPDDTSKFSFHTATGAGTDGWASPEVFENITLRSGKLKAMPMTQAMDVFSLGCVFYYVITGGRHPFGEDQLRRQVNIIDGVQQLIPCDIKYPHFQNLLLIKALIAAEPKARPSCQTILAHPVFWSKEKILGFLDHVANFVPNSSSSNVANCIAKLESCSSLVFGDVDASEGNQSENNDKEKNSNPVMSLIKLTSSYSQIYENLPKLIRKALAPNPITSLTHCLSRYPFLLNIVWSSFQGAKDEPTLQQYYYYCTGEFQMELRNCQKYLGEYFKFQIECRKERSELDQETFVGNGSSRVNRSAKCRKLDDECSESSQNTPKAVSELTLKAVVKLDAHANASSIIPEGTVSRIREHLENRTPDLKLYKLNTINSKYDKYIVQ